MFVTDGLLRKSVVICQSLGRQGIPVTAGSWTRFSPTFFSRYCSDQVIYPNPQTAPEEFVTMMLDYLKRNQHRVLFPADDATLMACSRYHDEFDRVTHLPIPRPEQVAYGLDKARMSKVAQRLGIPHPRTFLPRSAEDAARQAATLPGSAVIKPRSSSAGRGLVYLERGDDVAAAWEQVHQSYPHPMVQQRVRTGTKYDVCVIIDQRGNVVCSFAQKEIRHFPVNDGLSTVQESVWMPQLVERTVALLREIGWYGLAEAEFMEDPDTGEILLMEINPRFWASVQLAISCGVDFPYLLYQVARGKSVPEVHQYKVGVRCRWLFPGDMLHYLTNPQRGAMNPSFFNFRAPNTVYDGFYRDDWRATLGVMASVAHYAFDPDLWRMVFRRKKQASTAPATPPAPQTRHVGNAPLVWDD